MDLQKYMRSTVSLEEVFCRNDRQIIDDLSSMEKIMDRSERKDSLFRRVLIQAIGMVTYLPELTFDEEDVNMSIVDKMVKHPELLKVVDNWIFQPDQEQVGDLWKVKQAFTSFQKPTKYSKIYRGFNPKSLDQDTMGLQRQGWFGPKPSDFKVGDKFTYTTDRALSFTHHEGTASVFGGVVVSITPSRYTRQLLDIDLDLSYAIMKSDTDVKLEKIPYYMTYGELILLPTDRPIEFTVESINKKK